MSNRPTQSDSTSNLDVLYVAESPADSDVRLPEADSSIHIEGALRHCYGIGPVRLAQLHALGIRSWNDAVEQPERIPARIREAVLSESRRCLDALTRHDIDYFLARFTPRDRWRVMAHYRDHATFFDIETTGLEYDAQITVICCWHRGELHTFVENENLDDFLDLIDDVELLVSFNGATFDVPRVLDGFHIPDLQCPHLDLRWPCYHRGLPGGLKSIAEQLDIRRPSDLKDVDGALAVRLWERWFTEQDSNARERLLRYCASDVLLLALVSAALTGKQIDHAELWRHLPGDPSMHADEIHVSTSFSTSVSVDSKKEGTVAAATPVWSPPTAVGHFGTASPQKLRGRRRTG